LHANALDVLKRRVGLLLEATLTAFSAAPSY